jgi:hypothetical protein
MYVTIIGSASAALASLDSTHLKRRRLWEAVNSYLHQHKVHTTLQVKIRGYFEYVWGRNIDLQDDQSITNSLPPSLQAELCVAVNHHLIQQVPSFQDLDIGALPQPSVVHTFSPWSHVHLFECVPPVCPTHKSLPEDTVYAINKALVRRVFLPDEIVIRKGDQAMHVSAALCPSGILPCELLSCSYRDLTVFTPSDNFTVSN